MSQDAFTTIKLAQEMRRTILQMSFNCGQPSHIGGALSIVDILAVLYGRISNFDITRRKNRFILSKGHGVLALLSVLHHIGKISKEEISTFQKNGSEFIAHPIANPAIGIESSNGSLGQGLSYGIGISISYLKRRNEGQVFVLMGDGECYEGSVWEASITATETKLENMTVIIDCNGYQNDGAIGDKMNVKDISKKWRGFGWHVIECDGHDHERLYLALSHKHKNKPTAIIAKTTKGKGIKFMEDNNAWHHNRLTEKLFHEAMSEI